MPRFYTLPLLALVAIPLCARANPSLRFPVDCKIGQNCWVVNYVDTDTGPGVKDYACGTRSYNQHDGVDIGLPDRVAMQMGVAVHAAADGTVLTVRDSMEDREPTGREAAAMIHDGHGCGNGVMVDIGMGWKTLYCHMQKDSIAVKAGQAIKAGDILGKVGQSGAAEFPHLHISVLHDGRVVDPFTGEEQSSGCGRDVKGALWAPDAQPAFLAYDPVILYAAGFHGGVPDFEAIKIDSAAPRVLDAHPPALTFWTAFYGVEAGDTITMTITGPGGGEFASRTIAQESDKARQFYYIGRPAKAGIAPGAYKGVTILTRKSKDGAAITRRIERTVTIP